MRILDYLISTMNKRYFETEFDELTKQSTSDTDDPCWCGSGLKYRDCHLSVDETLLKNITERGNSCTKFS